MTTPTSSPTVGLQLPVALGLFVITGAEVLITYTHPAVGTLLVTLLGLAVIGAVLMLRYFMGMRNERSLLFWSLFPYLIFAMLMLDHIWADAHRVVQLHVPLR
jgi:heme/copper-type cytochrome/quinol oxidase subunit 4